VGGTWAKGEGRDKEILKVSNFMTRVTINNYPGLNQRKLMKGQVLRMGAKGKTLSGLVGKLEEN
jgi:hypothetical protein